MVVKVINLGFQQTANIAVAAGVKPAGFGLPSAAVYRMSFTTELRVPRLNIPFYFQDHAQSCEESALRSGMALRGVHTTDDEILARLGYNQATVRHREANPDGTFNWDNPNTGFVGDVHGKQSEGTGY